MGKVAFILGPLHFYWYGLIVAVAVLAAFFITLWQVRLTRQNQTVLEDLVLWGVPAGIVGARAYYVIFNWDIYRDSPLDAVAIWQGGLAIHGAFLAFILVLFLYTRRHDLSFWRWADLTAPGLAVAQFIGQWANFFNQESFGYPTDQPWGIYIDFALRPAGYEQFDFFHPVFMYESVWNLALLLLLLALAWGARRFPLRPGSIFLLYILLYAAGHFYLAGLRLDSELIFGVCLARLFSVLAAAAAIITLAWGRWSKAFGAGRP